jgi:hypothetical protein
VAVRTAPRDDESHRTPSRSVANASRSVDPATDAARDAGFMTETTTYFGSDLAALRRAAFRPVFAFITAFLVLSAAMIAFVAVLAVFGVGVDSAVWIRGSFVVASGIVLLAIARVAARGSRSALIRLRIIMPVVIIALIVIVSIPGLLPDWARVEQAVCGALLLPAAVMIWMPRVSILYPKTA